MSIVKKIIGNKIYQYEVTWDPKTKKQVSKYIGKIDANVSESNRALVFQTRALVVGKALTNDERTAIRKMLEWVAARPKGQSGYSHHDTALLLIERLGLDAVADPDQGDSCLSLDRLQL